MYDFLFFFLIFINYIRNGKIEYIQFICSLFLIKFDKNFPIFNIYNNFEFTFYKLIMF